MPAITSFTAKLAIISDAILSQFVTLSTQPSASNCTINAISGGLTPCGQLYIAKLVEVMFYELMEFFGGMVPYLGTLAMTFSAMYDPGMYGPGGPPTGPTYP